MNVHLHGTDVECIPLLIQVECSVEKLSTSEFSYMIYKKEDR